MYRTHMDTQLEDATRLASDIAVAGKFQYVLEIWPGALYEMQRPNGVIFRVSIGHTGTKGWAYVIDATGAAKIWQRTKHSGTASSPVDALRAAELAIRLDDAPYGDTLR